VAEKTAVATTLAVAAGGLTNLAIHFFLTDHVMNVGEICSGVLAGLVSITAGCSVVEPWAAVVIGIIGAFAYTAGSIILDKLEIDDAVNATPVHYFAGFWGLLAPGFFARQENMRRAYANFFRAPMKRTSGLVGPHTTPPIVEIKYVTSTPREGYFGLPVLGSEYY
jgi:Amt family ammonium transporter